MHPEQPYWSDTGEVAPQAVVTLSGHNITADQIDVSSYEDTEKESAYSIKKYPRKKRAVCKNC